MKVSKLWLQTFFDAPLPYVEAIADGLMFHAFEVEGVEKVGDDDIFDLKVLQRGHDCLSHRGVAKELSAIFQLPLARDPLAAAREETPSKAKESPLEPKTDAVEIKIKNPDLCRRYIAGYIRGVTVGPSPKWLRERLEAIGQKSINNVVDATNFVMFNTGQPLHAFDASKLAEYRGPTLESPGGKVGPRYSITVRNAQAGEKIIALDGKEYELEESTLVIGDGNSGEAIGIAGVKGGMPASITEETKDLIIESANFDGPSVRRTSRALKLRTDASQRFEEVISPELAAYGMMSVADLIVKIASGEVIGFVDEYPNPQKKQTVSVSVGDVQKILGATFGEKEIIEAFTRLGFSFSQKSDTFEVAIPFERLDLKIPEDLVEEVGRIIGYDHVPAEPLPPFSGKPEVNANFYAAEKAREELIAQGYSEVFTSVFAERGERVVANKVDGVRPYLRSNLIDGLKEAYERNKRNAEFLGLKEVKLFEIGAVWKNGEEKTMLGIADKKGVREQPLPAYQGDALIYEDYPLSTAERYQPFSRQPFIVRDVAFWCPRDTNAEEIEKNLKALAGDLCVKLFLFDRFEKDEKVSLAFRLIFQSFERTLTEGEIAPLMNGIYAALKTRGFEIR